MQDKMTRYLEPGVKPEEPDYDSIRYWLVEIQAEFPDYRFQLLAVLELKPEHIDDVTLAGAAIDDIQVLSPNRNLLLADEQQGWDFERETMWGHDDLVLRSQFLGDHELLWDGLFGGDRDHFVEARPGFELYAQGADGIISEVLTAVEGILLYLDWKRSQQ